MGPFVECRCLTSDRTTGGSQSCALRSLLLLFPFFFDDFLSFGRTRDIVCHVHCGRAFRETENRAKVGLFNAPFQTRISERVSLPVL